MGDIKNLLDGIAALLWPVIVICVLFIFRPAVAAIIESARSRKFTLKVGGQELTMEEASGQQRTLIADLQKQVVELQRRIEGQAETAPAQLTEGASPAGSRIRSILWVDDRPRNNSTFIQQLSDRGVTTDIALSTSEGLAKFGRSQYDCVISDVVRNEAGTDVGDAGFALLKKLRAQSPQVPFIFFTSPRAVREYRKQALSLGATGITDSPTELYALLDITKENAEA